MSTTNGNGCLPVDSVPDFVPGRNGGRLRRGNPGNKGGRGMPSKVREACLRSFAARVKILRKIADDTESSQRDRLAAMELLGKYAGLQKIEHTGEDGDAILVRVIREARPRVCSD